jgi:hypothetical protein
MKQFHGCIVDVYQYTEHDMYVYHEIIDGNTYIHVRRLDTLCDQGWNDLSVLFYSPIYDYSQTIHIGSSNTSYRLIPFQLEGHLTAPIIETTVPANYKQYILHMPEPNYTQISREQFNQLFDADLVVLPDSFYAIGIQQETTYIYSEKYALYWEIAPTMNFTISRIRKTEKNNAYFVICACDGYPENTPYESRMIPSPIPGAGNISENEYEVFHKNHLILTQNNFAIHANTIPMPERYYFILNQYREFRWKHAGMSFSDKIPKIMYASSPERSSKFIFKNHPEGGGERGDITQRLYFYEKYENHPNIVAIRSGWMHPNFVSSDEQMKYKYILDMDGCGASTWDAIAWKMRSGSVIFSVEGIWNRWFSDRFLPGIHYIPIKEDFSDLIEKYQWCEENQDKCKEIVYNACVFFDIYRFQEVEEYFYKKVFPRI